MYDLKYNLNYNDLTYNDFIHFISRLLIKFPPNSITHESFSVEIPEYLKDLTYKELIEILPWSYPIKIVQNGSVLYEAHSYKSKEKELSHRIDSYSKIYDYYIDDIKSKNTGNKFNFKYKEFSDRIDSYSKIYDDYLDQIKSNYKGNQFNFKHKDLIYNYLLHFISRLLIKFPPNSVTHESFSVEIPKDLKGLTNEKLIKILPRDYPITIVQNGIVLYTAQSNKSQQVDTPPDLNRTRLDNKKEEDVELNVDQRPNISCHPLQMSEIVSVISDHIGASNTLEELRNQSTTSEIQPIQVPRRTIGSKTSSR